MRKTFEDGLALGILIGFFLSTATLWLLSETQSVVIASFNVHATHLVTLAAAGLALWGISRQIQHNFEMNQEAKRSQLEAAKSSLPIVLSNIHAICAKRVYAIVVGRTRQIEGERWEISDFDLSVLKSCIEFSDGAERKQLQQIIRVYQVLIARWDEANFEDLSDARVLPKNDFALSLRWNQFFELLNWITLKFIAASLFSFARGSGGVDSKDLLRGRILFELESVSLGDDPLGGGFLLINNQNFSDFVDEMKKSKSIFFLDTDWNLY